MQLVSKRLYRVAGMAACTLLVVRVASAGSGRLVFDVTDREGTPVADAAIYAMPAEAPPPSSAQLEPPRAIMDQVDRAFVPHVLVAQTGTAIEFPNSDSVSHHVYSFSPAKPFELALYKQGVVHPPLIFDVSGVVTLGCNIHDDMVGYIVVVDTPHFAVSDGHGQGVLEGMPEGRYLVHTWTPRLRPTDLPHPVEITITADGTTELSSRLTEKLMPTHGAGHSSLTWSHY